MVMLRVVVKLTAVGTTAATTSPTSQIATIMPMGSSKLARISRRESPCEERFAGEVLCFRSDDCMNQAFLRRKQLFNYLLDLILDQKAVAGKKFSQVISNNLIKKRKS